MLILDSSLFRILCFVSSSLFCFCFDIAHSTLLPPSPGLSAIDYSQDHMELGAIWNGFSLNETGELAAAIEKTGQAIDGTCMTTVRLVSPWVQGIYRGASVDMTLATGSRAKLARTSARIFPVRVNYQEVTWISPPEACAIGNDPRCPRSTS